MILAIGLIAVPRHIGGLAKTRDARKSLPGFTPIIQATLVETIHSHPLACPPQKPTGRFVKGYKMSFALNAPGADADDYIYTDLRDNGAKTVRVFKTFNECYSAMDSVYPKTKTDLGVDNDGNLLSDKTMSINISANCVRVY